MLQKGRATPDLLERLKSRGVTDKDLAAAGFSGMSANDPLGVPLSQFVARADDGTLLPRDELGRLPPWTGNSHTLSIHDRSDECQPCRMFTSSQCSH
jgi:hypothetical protein